MCSAAYNGSDDCQFGAVRADRLAFSVSSRERGHDSCVHPLRREALFFARRCLYQRHQGLLLVTEVFLPAVLELTSVTRTVATDTLINKA